MSDQPENFDDERTIVTGVTDFSEQPTLVMKSSDIAAALAAAGRGDSEATIVEYAGRPRILAHEISNLIQRYESKLAYDVRDLLNFALSEDAELSLQDYLTAKDSLSRVIVFLKSGDTTKFDNEVLSRLSVYVYTFLLDKFKSAISKGRNDLNDLEKVVKGEIEG